MKFHWNEKYTTIAIYACIVAALTVLCIFFGIHIENVLSWVSTFLELLSPLMIGFVIAYLVNPMMKLFENKVFTFKKSKKPRPKMRRALSEVCAFLVFILILGILMALVIPQVALSYQNFMSQTSFYIRTVETWLTDVSEYLPFIDIEKVVSYVQDLVNDWYRILQNVTPYVTSFFAELVAQLRNAFLGLVLSAYFLAYKERLIAQMKKILYALLPQKRGDSFLNFMRYTDRTFGGFIIGTLLDALLIGVVTFFILMIFQMPYYPLISVIIAVTNIIPFFGPFIGGIPSALIIFLVDPSKALWFVLILVIIQQIEGNIICPRVMGEKLGLSSLGVIIAITLMGGLFGVAGMIFGVPLFALGYVLFMRFLNRRIDQKEQERKVAETVEDSSPAPEESDESKESSQDSSAEATLPDTDDEPVSQEETL